MSAKTDDHVQQGQDDRRGDVFLRSFFLESYLALLGHFNHGLLGPLRQGCINDAADIELILAIIADTLAKGEDEVAKLPVVLTTNRNFKGLIIRVGWRSVNATPNLI